MLFMGFLDAVCKSKSLGAIRCSMFLRYISYAHQVCIYLIKNTVKMEILWNIIAIKNKYLQI